MNLEKLQQLTDEVKEFADKFEQAYTTVRERAREKEVEYTKKDGETVTCKEHVIWEELYYTGRGSNAHKHLEADYKDLFDLEDALIAKKKEKDDFELLEFGFKGNQMTLSDLINLIQKVVKE
jgi:hypothetical protein